MRRLFEDEDFNYKSYFLGNEVCNDRDLGSEKKKTYGAPTESDWKNYSLFVGFLKVFSTESDWSM